MATDAAQLHICRVAYGGSRTVTDPAPAGALLHGLGAVIRRLPKGRGRTARVLTHLLHRPFEDVVAPDDLGVRLEVDPSDPFQLDIWLGAYQPHVVQFLRSSVKTGDSVLCAGLHIGYIAGVARALAGPSGHVYAAEPDITARIIAARNLERGDQKELAPITVFAGGLSDKAGEMYLHESWRLGHSSFGAHHHHSRDRIEPITVADDWLESLGERSLDILVLDVEGWEVHALKGMRRVIDASPNLKAMIEVSDWALQSAGSTRAELFSFWIHQGFEVRWVQNYGATFAYGVWGASAVADGKAMAGDVLCVRR